MSNETTLGDLTDDTYEDFESDFTEGWGSGYQSWLEEFGLEVLGERKGHRHNRTDGEYHRMFLVRIDETYWEVEVLGNVYRWDHEQIDDLLDAPVTEVEPSEIEEKEVVVW